MRRISKYAYSKSNVLLCILLTALMILYASIIMGSQSECVSGEMTENMSLLGLSFGYSYESVLSLFSSLSIEALSCYSKLLRIWDSIFPLLYGSMYIAWISIIYKNVSFRNEKLKLVNLYPLIPAIADLIENYFENLLVSKFIMTETLSHTDVQIASIITQFKWSFSTLNYLIIVSGIVILLVNRRVKPKE